MDNSPIVVPELIDGTLDPDPIRQFRLWFEDARTNNISQPEAMTLATATVGGIPSARVVLLKDVDDRGFVFYTNYLSRKGRELAENPRGALVFFWEEVGRQVRAEGSVVRVSAEESDSYFASRTRDRQLSSLASEQSAVTTREELDRRYDAESRRYDGKPIPRPPHWGGYRVVPHRIEFWQRRFSRMNDRLVYILGPDGGWSIRRLAP
jgi:pyridoxamine 5'-phosphate oxidase